MRVAQCHVTYGSAVGMDLDNLCNVLDVSLDGYESDSVDDPELAFFDAHDSLHQIYEHRVQTTEPNWESLRPFFAYLPLETVNNTYQTTTQWARNVERIPFRKHFKSRFPVLNIHHRHEAVATDTVYSDTPAVDDGATSAQVFVGVDSLVMDVYG